MVAEAGYLAVCQQTGTKVMKTLADCGLLMKKMQLVTDVILTKQTADYLIYSRSMWNMMLWCQDMYWRQVEGRTYRRWMKHSMPIIFKAVIEHGRAWKMIQNGSLWWLWQSTVLIRKWTCLVRVEESIDQWMVLTTVHNFIPK